MNPESTVVWSAVIGLIAVVTVPYLVRFRRKRVHAERRFAEAQSLGITRPRAQYPQIDPLRCIGCGSCAGVCPEGDVLAVVNGVARVVNGQRCVGHGHCERVCPVGALHVTLGDTSDRPDIPILTPAHETTVPGLYIAGELTGLSLIRNAVAHGKLVMADIVARLKPDRDRERTDVVIVGAGPAGLTAALAAIESGLSYRLLEKSGQGGTILHYPRRKLVMTQPVELPMHGRLKKEEYTKEELLAIWEEISAAHGIEVETSVSVLDVQRDHGGLCVTTDTGLIHAHTVVLAMGRRGTPRKLEVPGEDQTKVVYQLVDAQSYARRKVLVVGGGDSAVEAAVALSRQPGTTVAISYRKSGFFRVKKKNENAIGEAIASGRVLPYFESQVVRIEPDAVVINTNEGEVTLANDDVIVLIGGVPPFAQMRDMGIKFNGDDVATLIRDSKSDTAVSAVVPGRRNERAA